MNARETLGKKKEYIRQLDQEKQRLLQRNAELRAMGMSKSDRFQRQQAPDEAGMHGDV